MRRIKLFLFVVILTILYSVSSSAQAPDILWTKIITENNVEEKGYSVRETRDGGFIIIGSVVPMLSTNYDVFLIKTDSEGNKLWSKIFGGVFEEGGYSVEQTFDNGFIIAGVTESFGNGGSDIYLIKTDSIGNLIWSKTFGGNQNDVAFSVQQYPDGGFIIAGVTESFGNGGSDIYLIKTDSIGNLIWSKTFGGQFNDLCFSIKNSFDNGFVLAGYVGYDGHNDLWFLRINSDGDEISSKSYGGGGNDVGFSIQKTHNDKFVLYGVYDYSTSQAAWVINVEADGTQIWNEIYASEFPPPNYPNNIEETMDKGFVLISNDIEDYYIAKIDSVGDIIWTKNITGQVFEEGSQVIQTSDNGYLLIGNSQIPNVPGTVIKLVKLAPDNLTSIDNELQHSNYQLLQNYPNPFNPSTSIQYTIRSRQFVTLRVYDVLGNEIVTLVNKEKPAGSYEVEFNAVNLPSGVYFYQINSGSFIETKKMILMK